MIPDSFIQKLDGYRSMIDRQLQSLLNSRSPAYLYDPIRYVFSGKGKRLRPVLVLLVAKSFGASEKKAMPAALAVEILHNFSLVHDDIMDQDDVRHGLPAVHVKWDESAAILAGDAIFAIAHIELTKLGKYSLNCTRFFNDAAIKLCEGQALDKAYEEIKIVSPEEYLDMVRLKTGALISLCCQLGGVLGNAADEKIVELTKFGEHIGQAFQIQDDVLEIFSTTQKMGKSLGSDVMTSKKTYLTCQAIKNNSGSWNALMKDISGRDMAEVILPKLRTYFIESGIMEDARENIDALISKAKINLGKINCDGSDLFHFVDLVLMRKN